MQHHIVYWKLVRREVDVDDAALEAMLDDERRGEIYIEYLDGIRRRLAWDDYAHRWIAPAPAQIANAA